MTRLAVFVELPDGELHALPLAADPGCGTLESRIDAMQLHALATAGGPPCRIESIEGEAAARFARHGVPASMVQRFTGQDGGCAYLGIWEDLP